MALTFKGVMHPLSLSGSRTTLKAVTAANPCAVCGGDHKCARGDDGLIVCGRPPGETPGFRYLGRCQGDEQFGLYRVAELSVSSIASTPARPPEPVPNWD